MLASIVRRYVGRSVYGMANESFDNLVTKERTGSANERCARTMDENVHSIVWSSKGRRLRC